jgi:hypothetical protein
MKVFLSFQMTWWIKKTFVMAELIWLQFAGRTLVMQIFSNEISSVSQDDSAEFFFFRMYAEGGTFLHE